MIRDLAIEIGFRIQAAKRRTTTSTNRVMSPTMVMRLVFIAMTVAMVHSWVNSESNVHTFLTFDSGLNDTAIHAHAKQIDFVWGGHSPSVWHQANPQTVVSAYVPYSRDPASTNLSWWQDNHPEFVLYQCDRKTPAYLFSDPNVPLDISNEDVVNWQVEQFAKPLYAEGYNAIAADNFGLDNGGRACGVWRQANQWVQLYSGQASDATYAAAQLKWLGDFSSKLHEINASDPMLLIPNFAIASTPWNGSDAQQVLTHVDGVLDERGFTGYGSSFISASELENVWSWMGALQSLGKAYYSINEMGKVDADVTLSAREWAAAAWLLGNSNASAVFISCVQCYGKLQLQPEYAMQLGAPVEERKIAQGVHWRTFDTGLVLLNDVGASTATVSLPGGYPVRYKYTDVNGDDVGLSVSMDGGAGLVLVRGTAQ